MRALLVVAALALALSIAPPAFAAESRDLLLAVVLFPLVSPTLLAAVAGTRELLGGAPLSELVDYFVKNA